MGMFNIEKLTRKRVKRNIVLRSRIGFAALEVLDTYEEINSPWDMNRKNITIRNK
jgi:hypothetical protein